MKNTKTKIILLSTTFYLLTFCALAQNNTPLSNNAPKDKPVEITSLEQLKKLDKKIAPYVKKAKKTLPKAKKKFLSGLKKGEAFFLVTRIFDKDGKYEQVFVRIKNWEGENISGTIANDLSVVKEYKSGQLINIKETDILDWVISKPDGSEEGNFVGKYLDTLQ